MLKRVGFNNSTSCCLDPDIIDITISKDFHSIGVDLRLLDFAEDVSILARSLFKFCLDFFCVF